MFDFPSIAFDVEVFLSDSVFFLGQSNPGVFTYFRDSNLAGKVIILILGVGSMIAWTVMVSKVIQLRALERANRKVEDRVRNEAFLDLETERVPTKNCPFGAMAVAAVQAYYRFPGGETVDEGVRAKRLSQVENALQRILARHTLEYESRMTVLATIVTGAPFLGLLGTVWGVMDAFGAVAAMGTATLKTLAPGVSGALLTTVAGLLVAIPSVFGYNVLLTKIRRMTMQLEFFASTVADRIELEDRY